MNSPDSGRRRTVAVYDRPHPLRRRKVWLPIAIGVASLAIWILIAWFRS